jgi:phosphoglycolate phosphatase
MDALFFDLDGTLSDPFEGFARSLRFAFEELGLDMPPDAELRTLIGPPLHVSMRARFADPAQADEVIRLFRVRYADTGLFENVVYPGVRELLDALAGRLPLFVCTTKPRVYALQILQHFGLGATFAAVYGSELDGTYADKRILLARALAEQRLAPASRVALLGDRELDLIAARTNAVAAWGAGWGYGTAQELAGADHVFAAPHEVAAFIAR